jgi:hypothetical protein
VKAKRLIVLVLFVLGCVAAFPAGKTSLFTIGKPAVGERDLGVIFNTGDILFDLESYQGGVGAKIGLGPYVLRPMADILLNTGVNPFSLTLGAVLEKHILPGPVSLYWGPSAELGFTILTTKIDADNWTQTIAWELLSAGCVAGIELFILESLSLFVEYSLALTLGLNTTRTSVAGTVDSTNEFTYKLDLGMGNSAMFGIVFYLTRKKR